MFDTQPTEQCLVWRAELLEGVSLEDAVVLRKRLDELDLKKGYVAANTWFRGVIERFELLGKISVMRSVVGKECDRLYELETQGKEPKGTAMAWLRRVVKRLHFCDKMITEFDGEQLAQWAWKKSSYFETETMGIYLESGIEGVKGFIHTQLVDVGIQFKDWDDKEKLLGLMARMITTEWWVRQAKRQWVVVEDVLRECGEVERFKSPYVSNWALRKAERQAENNRAFLEGWEAINELGQSFTLAQLSEKGVSDPDNRFAEMVVRAKGLEEIAEEQGHQGYFITLTAPSKYHPISQGYRNKKFWRAECPSVRSAHAYLNGVWRRFRAWCNRHDIPFYGLRTVEPHHDGCPHWHLMLWVDPDHSQGFLSAFSRYALKEDGGEAGAKKYRVKVKKIDPDKGSAVGYIVKYISKNIHGKHVDTDHETGRSGSDAAKRIVAWARLNRIRQFQFLGGASVTVWRELRKFGKDNTPDYFKDIYHAANRADFGGFVKLMGGVFAGKNQTLQTHYSDEVENQYGEMVKAVKGVKRGIEVLITRIHEWTVQRRGASSLEDGEAVPWTRVNKCTGPNFGPNYEPTGSGGGGQYVSPG
ncbi:replication endonuclease [Marinomonas transparens]|uniref:Replication endonuclease n=1 Tax=Marinomonas transparens TaxID=2795388 RepID=A0A934JM85_9GAMM|nr:replication endonuclease [Marinomonas transparens]MBJ7536983.1 replication endonuclease [Marinomonas transparens]